MRLDFILIFFIIFLYLFITNTPFWLINMIFNFTQNRYIHLDYIISKNNKKYLKNYNFLHSNYDGKLVSNILRKKKINIHNLNEINNHLLYKEENIVKNFLKLDEKYFDKNYTHFGNICAHLIKYIMLKKCKNLNIAIVVNNRNDSNLNEGNYITFAFFNVYPVMDVNIILSRYKNAVNKARNKQVKYFSIYDLYLLNNCDLILNSWRDLSTIKNDYGYYLERYEKNILNKHDLNKFLLSKRKRKLVYFDYFDNNYIINKVKYLEV